MHKTKSPIFCVEVFICFFVFFPCELCAYVSGSFPGNSICEVCVEKILLSYRLDCVCLIWLSSKPLIDLIRESQ